MRCERAAPGELVARYVSGKLPDAEQAAFEEHLLACSDCQDALELALEARRALAADVPPARRRHASRRVALFVLAAASIVVIAGSLTLMQRSRTVRLAEIAAGTIDPPVYLGTPVRDARTATDSLFDDAMASYGREDYPAAATKLSKVVTANPAAAPPLFFRGASYLMLGRAADARADFSRVIDSGNEIYGVESRYYRALAELAAGDKSHAVEDLRAVPPADERVGARSTQLLDRLEAAAPRSR